MIDKFEFDPPEGMENEEAYPDKPRDPEANREQHQRPHNQLMVYINELTDKYASNTAGSSGAGEIGSETISGLMDPTNPLIPAQTVRKQIQAAQKNIDDIVAGIIPDGSINTAKIAEEAVTPSKISGGVGCNYVRNRIPTSEDDFDAGYKIGNTWTIPFMTLNNLIPHATGITPADWTVQNGSLAGTGSKGTLTCGNGTEYATAKITIAPIAGHVYALFGELKITSTNVITEISLNIDNQANPVKDTVYKLCEIVTAPTEFKIKITAATGAALNGTILEFDKVCVVDMTADMVGVPFDAEGAITYFSTHTAFINQEPEYEGMSFYCTGSGTWQSSSQLSVVNQTKYGVENADDALSKAFDIASGYPITLIAVAPVISVAGFFSFSAEVKDEKGFFNPTTPTRITIPAGVSKIKISAQVQCSMTGYLGRIEGVLYKNGAELPVPVRGGSDSSYNASMYINVFIGSYVLDVVAGDYFQLYGNPQAQGSSIACNWLAVEYV